MFIFRTSNVAIFILFFFGGGGLQYIFGKVVHTVCIICIYLFGIAIIF